MDKLSPEEDERIRQIVERTLAYWATPEGRAALLRASEEAQKAGEPFRQARNVPRERLYRPFTI